MPREKKDFGIYKAPKTKTVKETVSMPSYGYNSSGGPNSMGTPSGEFGPSSQDVETEYQETTIPGELKTPQPPKGWESGHPKDEVPPVGGSTRLNKSSMKYQALIGRKENLAAKKAFACGEQDGRKNE